MTDQVENVGVIQVANARLSFPHLYEAHKSTADAKPKFSADFILDPNNPIHVAAWKKFEGTIAEMAQTKWPDHWEAILGVVRSDRKLRCYGKGEEKLNRETMAVMDGYAGKLYWYANNDVQPDLYDQKGRLIDTTNALDKESPRFYGGCYVNVGIKIWLQDNKHGRGVRADLLALQFAADGEPFGTPPVDTSTMFQPVEGAPEPTAGDFAPEAGADKQDLTFL
jgi:hypothetical protein